MRMSHVLLTLSVLFGPSSAASGAAVDGCSFRRYLADLAGVFICTGKNFDGTTYEGVVEIVRHNDMLGLRVVHRLRSHRTESGDSERQPAIRRLLPRPASGFIRTRGGAMKFSRRGSLLQSVALACVSFGGCRSAATRPPARARSRRRVAARDAADRRGR